MMDSEIFERYKRAQTKFNLPKLDELRETFRFELEHEGNMFDQIRSEISDRLFVFTERIIEPLIGDCMSISSVFEQNMISSKERKQVFDLYRKIQELRWENNLLSLNPNDKQTAIWINKVWSFWNKEMKDDLMHICKKLSFSWSDLKGKDIKTHYHG